MIDPLCPDMALRLARKRELILRAALSVVDEAIVGRSVDPSRLQWAADIARVRVFDEHKEPCA